MDIAAWKSKILFENCCLTGPMMMGQAGWRSRSATRAATASTVQSEK